MIKFKLLKILKTLLMVKCLKKTKFNKYRKKLTNFLNPFKFLKKIYKFLMHFYVIKVWINIYYNRIKFKKLLTYFKTN